jgi:hypothetical protein
VAISPDTKDWTWVLERQCAECGFDASTQARRGIGQVVRTTAQAWILVLSGPAVRIRPSADRWSPLEYGCHVRDVFRIFDMRLQLMLTEDSPTFANWDQDLTAVEGRYDSQDPDRVTEELEEAASVVASRFDGVGEDEWSRQGLRSNGSRFTVESLGIYMIHDPVHHLWDVSVGSDANAFPGS